MFSGTFFGNFQLWVVCSTLVEGLRQHEHDGSFERYQQRFLLFGSRRLREAARNEFFWEGVAKLDLRVEGGELLELGFRLDEHRVLEEDAEREVELQLKWNIHD